ncbi:hypothetical protein ACIBCT_20715 [Streptosporangium sp. NPDC050855]|uniref:hypothetical protein n=1 Tax=Streptosporangium sp. NPDC050855 TaxID=3366194 RepID=UPI00378E9045
MSVLTAAPELRWEDPPALRRTGPRPPALDWPTIAGKLRANPDKWAIVQVEQDRAVAAQTAHRIKTGRIKALYPLGQFKAVARTVDGECRVYARYVGGEGK